MDSESLIVTNCDDEAPCVHACLVTLCKKNPSQSVLQGPEAAAAGAQPPPAPPPVTTLSHDRTHMTSTLPSSTKARRGVLARCMFSLCQQWQDNRSLVKF